MKSKIAIAGVLVGMSVSNAQATEAASDITYTDRNDTYSTELTGPRHGFPRHRHADEPKRQGDELSEEEKEFLAYMDSVLSAKGNN